MAWTSPTSHTFTTGEIVTAATMVSFLTNNMADLDRRTTLVAAAVATSQTTTNTAYVDLTTTGPAVTITVGSSGIAQVGLYASQANTGTTGPVCMGYAVSGTTTIAATDSTAVTVTPPAVSTGNRSSAVIPQTGLTAGSNTFTAKYRVVSGTGAWADRRIGALPASA